MDHQITSPTIIPAANSSKLNRLKRAHPYATIIDHYTDQLDELFEVTHPKYADNPTKKHDFLAKLFGHDNFDQTGNWVFFPWNNTLTHILDETNFQKVRTARNFPLISHADQKKFHQLKVGVVGLSVGNSIVQSILHTGGANTIKIADPDTLGLSNLNRIRANVADLGKNKTTLTKEQIYQVNPYANVHPYPKGITPDNIEVFFTQPKLDLVIDAADNLTVKNYLRLMARALKIPLLMTTDNGHESNTQIIRFDQSSDAGGMKGLPELAVQDIVNAFSYHEPLNISDKQKLALIAQMVGPNNVSLEMQKGSMLRAQNKIAGWPQLATTVFLGGSLAAFAAHLIAKKTRTYPKQSSFNIKAHLTPSHHSKASKTAHQKHTQIFLNFLKNLS